MPVEYGQERIKDLGNRRNVEGGEHLPSGLPNIPCRAKAGWAASLPGVRALSRGGHFQPLLPPPFCLLSPIDGCLGGGACCSCLFLLDEFCSSLGPSGRSVGAVSGVGVAWGRCVVPISPAPHLSYISHGRSPLPLPLGELELMSMYGGGLSSLLAVTLPESGPHLGQAVPPAPVPHHPGCWRRTPWYGGA